MADSQASPSALEEKIDAMITQLASKSASKRREAAYFLGEAAAADAVQPLVDIYQKDKDASVRAAAAYALGMYKAVEQAINRGQEEHVIELLRGIEEDGKLGRRAPTGRSVRILLGLLVSLLVLGVVYLARADIKASLFGSSKSHATLVADVNQRYTLVRDDTRNLQTDLLNVIQNQPLSCIGFFNNPAPYQLDPVDGHSYPDIADIVDQLNGAQASLASAKAAYDAACNNGAKFGAAEAQQTFQTLLPALQALDPLQLKLTQAQALQPTVTPEPPTAAPTTASAAQPTAVPPTPAPGTPVVTLQSNVTLQPTTATDAQTEADIKKQLPALFDIIDDVTSPRGSSTLLLQYWQDVQKSGTTQGCSITTVPDIPNTVFIPEADLQASSNLRDAVQLINNGLSALHTGWTNFEFACNSHSLQNKVATELPSAQVAADAFAAADAELQTLQNGA
ncbi:MAG TPA: HEAT repeat domain-containing protein [Phototrophicaceae bacterium]|nr:HEAT repeat domain-containing protein [Phototrophicaceae bacterium]